MTTSWHVLSTSHFPLRFWISCVRLSTFKYENHRSVELAHCWSWSSVVLLFWCSTIHTLRSVCVCLYVYVLRCVCEWTLVQPNHWEVIASDSVCLNSLPNDCPHFHSFVSEKQADLGHVKDRREARVPESIGPALTMWTVQFDNLTAWQLLQIRTVTNVSHVIIIEIRHLGILLAVCSSVKGGYLLVVSLYSSLQNRGAYLIGAHVQTARALHFHHLTSTSHFELYLITSYLITSLD